jgi:hypothetical protein
MGDQVMSAAKLKYRIIRKTIIVFGLLLTAAIVYVVLVNLDSKNMTESILPGIDEDEQ